MRRAGILTGGVVALILLAGVCIPQPPSSRLSIHESVDFTQPWFDRASLSMRDVAAPSNSDSTNRIIHSKEMSDL